MKVNGAPIGPSLERHLRARGFRFTANELRLALASAIRLQTNIVHLPKGQSFTVEYDK